MFCRIECIMGRVHWRRDLEDMGNERGSTSGERRIAMVDLSFSEQERERGRRREKT